MSGDVDDSNADDEHDLATRANFRDYPNTGLVLVALMSSSIAWMLYKWMGKKRPPARPEGKDAESAKASGRQETSTD
jgi:hypothetical protein